MDIPSDFMEEGLPSTDKLVAMVVSGQLDMFIYKARTMTTATRHTITTEGFSTYIAPIKLDNRKYLFFLQPYNSEGKRTAKKNAYTNSEYLFNLGLYKP